MDLSKYHEKIANEHPENFYGVLFTLKKTIDHYHVDKLTFDEKSETYCRTWVNSSTNQAYVTIPKNGWMTTNIAFDHCDGWERIDGGTTNRIPDQVKTIVIGLRDPVSRFKSAMNMILELGQYDDSYYGSLIDFDMVTGYQENVHFFPQTYFIESLDIPNSVEIKYVYMQGNLIDELNKYFNWNLPVLHEHKSAMNLITDVNEDLIRKWYQDDYDLIESVEFVNR